MSWLTTTPQKSPPLPSSTYPSNNYGPTPLNNNRLSFTGLQQWVSNAKTYYKTIMSQLDGPNANATMLEKEGHPMFQEIGGIISADPRTNDLWNEIELHEEHLVRDLEMLLKALQEFESRQLNTLRPQLGAGQLGGARRKSRRKSRKSRKSKSRRKSRTKSRRKSKSRRRSRRNTKKLHRCAGNTASKSRCKNKTDSMYCRLHN